MGVLVTELLCNFPSAPESNRCGQYAQLGRDSLAHKALEGVAPAFDRRLRFHRTRDAKIAHGPAHFAAILHALAVPAPELMAGLTILTELIGGGAALVGAFIPLASIPMAVVLLTAMFSVHLPYGFSAVKLQAVTNGGAQFGPPGYEVDLLYLACLAALVIGGSGPLGLSDVLRRRTNSDHTARFSA